MKNAAWLEWINENVPMLKRLIRNKYVDMMYDRFASLDAQRQRQIIIGTIAALILLLVFIVFMGYSSYWAVLRQTQRTRSLAYACLQFQRELQESAVLQEKGAVREQDVAEHQDLRQVVMDAARMAHFPPQSVIVEPLPADAPPGPGLTSGSSTPSSQIRIERMNLLQLKMFLQRLELGPQRFAVERIQIANDDKVRGFMRVDIRGHLYGAQASAPPGEAPSAGKGRASP